jgi:hypothetical protein
LEHWGGCGSQGGGGGGGGGGGDCHVTRQTGVLMKLL